MSERQVRQERTDWRDSQLNDIHSIYGYNLPCEEAEFLMVEYDMSTPVALVDYISANNPAYISKGVIDLCDDRLVPIPYFIAHYTFVKDKITNFSVIPCNDAAKRKIGDTASLTEKDYVKLLYELREPIIKGRTEEGKEIANKLPAIISNTANNWTGQIISHRHRDWGWNCPVVDLDFIVINDGKVSALVEYKESQSYQTPRAFKASTSGKAISALASQNNTPIPFLLAYYEQSFGGFRVLPMTPGWEKYNEYFDVKLTREKYFNFLKQL